MFQDKLKEYRKKLGLSQEELGKKIFVSRSAVAKWEQGRGMPNDQSMEDLANLFEVKIEELYDYSDVTKLSRKNKRNLFIFLISIFILLVISISICIWQIMSPHSFYKNQDFFSKRILEEFHLGDLKSPYYSLEGVVYQDTTYACKVERISFYKEYAYYLADFIANNEEYLLLDLIYEDLDILTYVHSYSNYHYYMKADPYGYGSYSFLQKEEIYPSYTLYYSFKEDKENIFQMKISYGHSNFIFQNIFQDFSDVMIIELTKTLFYTKTYGYANTYAEEIYVICEESELERLDIALGNYKVYIDWSYYVVDNDKYNKTVIYFVFKSRKNEITKWYNISIEGRFLVNGIAYSFTGVEDSIQVEGVTNIESIVLEVSNIEGKIIKLARK